MAAHDPAGPAPTTTAFLPVYSGVTGWLVVVAVAVAEGVELLQTTTALRRAWLVVVGRHATAQRVAGARAASLVCMRERLLAASLQAAPAALPLGASMLCIVLNTK